LQVGLQFGIQFPIDLLSASHRCFASSNTRRVGVNVAISTLPQHP
jgi:hypothetical protein